MKTTITTVHSVPNTTTENDDSNKNNPQQHNNNNNSNPHLKKKRRSFFDSPKSRGHVFFENFVITVFTGIVAEIKQVLYVMLTVVRSIVFEPVKYGLGVVLRMASD